MAFCRLYDQERRFEEVLDRIREQGFEVFAKDNVRLICADSAQVLPLFPNRFFDAIVTDPPYGLGALEYDDSDAIFFALEDEFRRVLKETGWLVFWWTTKRLPEAFAFRRFCYRWMFIAKFKGTVSRSQIGSRTYIPILVFDRNGKGKIQTKLHDSIVACELPALEGKAIKQGDFKPTFTQAILLRAFSPQGGVVLDPFAGYGSLLLAGLLACPDLTVVGVEKDKTRFEVAKVLLEERTVPFPIPELEKQAKEDRKEGLKQLSLFRN